MMIGIYVTTVAPRSPSQARLQDALFAGLAAVSTDRFRFVVFSHDGPLDDGAVALPHYPLAVRGRYAQAGRMLRAWFARRALDVWRLLGASGGRTMSLLSRWSLVEPPHFQQIRDLNIRLLWNMNQHELKVPVPFIRTIWEANHRIHSMYPEYAYSRYGYDVLDGDMADSLGRASYVITGTEVGKQQLVSMVGVHEAKVRVIPFPAPQLSRPQEPDDMPRGPYLFYPSKFWPHKNHVVILEALKLLRDVHGLEMRCVMTGSDGGNLDYVMRYAERLGVRDMIDYRGEVPEAQLAALYRGAFALTYVSAVGPDNLPPLEAMGLSCPVITADVPGAREQYGDAALFFPPTDERALALQVARLSVDPALREKLVERGLRRAESLRDDRYCAGVIEILHEFAAVARGWEYCDSVVA